MCVRGVVWLEYDTMMYDESETVTIIINKKFKNK